MLGTGPIQQMMWKPDFGLFDRVRNIVAFCSLLFLVLVIVALVEERWVGAGVILFCAYLSFRVRPHLKTSEQARQRYEAKQARKARG